MHIIITLNKSAIDIDKSSIKINTQTKESIFHTIDDTIIVTDEEYNTISGSLEMIGNELIFTPLFGLVDNMKYKVLISKNNIKSINSFGLKQDYTFSFTVNNKVEYTNTQGIATSLIDNLQWQDNREILTSKANWKDSKKYCSSLALGDYDDWRLPSISELESIYDKKNIPSIKKGFKNIEKDYYWSDTEYTNFCKENSTTKEKVCINSWIVDFAGHKYISSYQQKTSSFFIRCVRNGE
jgi:hypothetical protein